jgi:type IV secretory pathway TraG/TraD family ATPase VirD4
VNDKIERIVGASFSFGGVLSLYLYLKLTGKIPGPEWWILNDLDYYLVKIFYLLKFAVPAIILFALPIIFLKKFRERKELLLQEQLRDEREHERYRIEQQRKEEIILARFRWIEAELEKINNDLGQINRSPVEVTESVLQDFL